MLENKAPTPQTALPSVNQSARWNSRIMEKRLGRGMDMGNFRWRAR